VGTPLNLIFMDHPALNLFFQRYAPAYSFKEATQFLTTEEINTMLADHGVFIERNELYDWLIKHGYKDDFIEGMKMVWLLKAN